MLDVLIRRAEVLDHVGDSPAHKRDLIEELDSSRSTIDRAISELEEHDLVELTDDGIAATLAGRLAAELYQDFTDTLTDIDSVKELLEPLQNADSFSVSTVTGGEVYLASDPMPYSCLKEFKRELEDTKRYRALLPTLDDPRHVRLLYEHVVTEQRPATLILTPTLFETFRQEYPRRLAAMAETGRFTVRTSSEVPPFSLVITGEQPDVVVTMIVFHESGGVHGVLMNDSFDAVQWAEGKFDAIAAEASEPEAEILPDTDGGTVVSPAWVQSQATGEPLPLSLKREGFEAVDRHYFRSKPVATPETAWRVGLSIPEVQAGYAIERYRNVPTDDGTADRSLTDELMDTLTDEGDCLLVGPPGAGKSTVLKRVACEWYRRKNGPVLYRRSGRARSFESVEHLVSVVEAMDGHVLIVVEDAVRPESNDVFRAMDWCAYRDDVTFLFDATTEDWRNPPAVLDYEHSVEVVQMPALDLEECQRLASQYEQTTGQTIQTDVDTIYENVKAEAGSSTAPNELLLYLHRLSAAARQPTAAEPTGLQDEVADIYDAVETDELARGVCLLANALNAAGHTVEYDALFAVARNGEFDAVRDAIESLEGTILFRRGDGSYRTVHRSWSVSFLAHYLTAEGEQTGSEEFGRVISDFLSLADSAEGRGAIARFVDERRELRRIESEPEAWVAEVIERLYRLGQAKPKLAPLFGTEETIALPRTCPKGLVHERLVWLGKLHLASNQYERAADVFDTLPTDELEYETERLLGLGRIARERGDYERALELATQCLEEVEGSEDELLRGRTALELGYVKQKTGDLEAAKEFYQDARASFETVGDSHRMASVLHSLGTTARFMGEYDRAARYVERSLEIAKILGDKDRQARSLHELGAINVLQSQWDDAREYFETSLSLHRDLGYYRRETSNLVGLGTVSSNLGNFSTALEYIEDALQIARDEDFPVHELEALETYCYLLWQTGDHEKAREQIERGLELSRALDHRVSEIDFLFQRAYLWLQRANFDRAREDFEQSRDLAKTSGYTRWEAKNLNGLGIVHRHEGDLEAAISAYETARKLTNDAEHSRAAMHGLVGLGQVCRYRGDYELADACLSVALDSPDETQDRFMTAFGMLARARLCYDSGELERARDSASSVREEFETMSLPVWAGRCSRLLGRIAAAAGDTTAAQDHFRTALDTFQEVGSPHDELLTVRHALKYSAPADRPDWLADPQSLIQSILEDTPGDVVETHRDWLDERTNVDPNRYL